MRADRTPAQLRVVLITRYYPPFIGGAEKVLSYLAPALAAEGANVTVLTMQAPGLAPFEEVDVPPSASSSGGRLRVARLATSRARFVGTWLYMRNLKRWLRRHASTIDVAYVSMLKHDAYVTLEVGQGGGRRRRFPVLLRPEGAGATGDLAWQKWGRFGRAIALRCKRADALVSISDAITTELLQEGFPPERIHPLPNGVPIPSLAWQPRTGWAAHLRAIFVGRLAPEKRLDLLVRAWPLVLEQYPGARLTLVGEGPERPRLERLIGELGIGPSVELPGASADPGVRLADSDLFVLPSSEEGMSIALLEAMALGIPLVASDIPGNRRLVNDQVQGRLAPPDHPTQLARVIREQWANPDQARKMGEAARRRVIDEFSIAAVARKHLALFQRVIDETTKKAQQGQPQSPAAGF